MSDEAPKLPSGNCTWIHVRRSDALTENNQPGKFRSFHTLEEYLIKGDVFPGDSVLLLTDDQMAIEEAQILHPDYTWIFWHRIRHRGQAKFNANIPSNFHAHETLVLLSELELAGQCAKGVHASSGLVQMF